MAGITHSWNGTILTITSDSGTSSCDLKGAKGDDGARGAMGLPGDANLIEAVDKAEKAATDAETALSQLGTARDEAVAAAAQVKAIVAGNEAYTKAESDSRFANAIKPTATGEIATAADSGNYPLQGLSIYGKTTQAGTPTPTSPIDLVNIGVGSIGVKVVGKNLLKNTAITQTKSGVSFTVNTDGSITANGTATDVVFYEVGNMLLDSGIKYILSGTPKGATDTTYRLDMRAPDGASIYAIDTGEGAQYISEKDINILCLIRISAGINLSNITFNPMITINEKLTYEPYKESGSITLNTPNGLPGIPVSSGGNYTDSTGQQWVADEIDLAAGVYRHWVDKWVLDGTQRVEKQDESGTVWTRLNYYELKGKMGGAIICDYYKQRNFNSGVVLNTVELHGTAEYLIIRTEGTLTVDEWNARLKNNPITIYAQKTTPTETPLTAAEIAAFKALQSQYPNTTVYSDANAGIAATYVADTKLYIDNKFNELSTALVAMGG